MAEALLLVLLAYLALGLLFGLAFVTRGVGRLDPAAHAAPWTFRVLILPGAAALWPLLALRWMRARREATP